MKRIKPKIVVITGNKAENLVDEYVKRVRLQRLYYNAVVWPELNVRGGPLHPSDTLTRTTEILNGGGLYTIVTMAKCIINFLGEEIEQSQFEDTGSGRCLDYSLSADDVLVVLVDTKGKEVAITELHFNNKGVLEGWPVGYFAP